MANEILYKTGAVQLLFADHATDFGAAPATAGNSLIFAGTPTDVEMDLTGLAATGGAYASAKADLTTPWATQWSVDACLEFETAPADGGVVEFYWAPSPSGTAATGNPGLATGTKTGFTDTSGNLGQLRRIGSLTLKNTVINIGHVGVFSPPYEWGCMVIVNQGSTALRSTATAMDETHIVMTELITEAQ